MTKRYGGVAARAAGVTTFFVTNRPCEPIEDHGALWGHGWYILPGPMRGSWTSFAE